MSPKKSNGKRVPVSSLKHKEKSPKTVSYPGLLYARDPSLDPQLVWKGKDEQDQKPLEVPAVPVYIQEKIHPQAIVEQVKAEAKKAAPGMADLFADFNNIKFEDLVDFYRHEQNWSNRMILGDSLLVMTSLAEKEGLKGKVQMIYIDPPYGIKFGSNWQVSTRKRDVKDGKAEDAVRQPEQIKAFRDTWELGIHSYLTYLRDRLTVARELLSETGSVFVQIGDENVHLVRSLLDEAFGSENFISQVHIVKTAGQTDALLASLSDTLLWYAKNREAVKYRQLHVSKGVGFGEVGQYYYADIPSEGRRRLTEADQ
jgi:adenine-specific DNA-methyltransferase